MAVAAEDKWAKGQPRPGISDEVYDHLTALAHEHMVGWHRMSLELMRMNAVWREERDARARGPVPEDERVGHA